jgi:hypothetical protein
MGNSERGFGRTAGRRGLENACRDRVHHWFIVAGSIVGCGCRGRRSPGGGIDRIDTNAGADTNGASATLATTADGNAEK